MAAQRGRSRGAIAIALVVVVVGLVVLFWIVVEPGEPGSFYSYPSKGDIGAPGSLIRSMPVHSIVRGATVTKLVYSSTDDHGRAIAVSGVVIVPTGRPPAGGDRPVVAWAHGTTGVVSRCAPSLEPDAGVKKIPLLDQLVAEGDIVVATDYAGLGTSAGIHPYLDGQSEGRAVLDSIRAAEAFAHESATTPALVMGHSQGGHATLFAAQLSTSYAGGLHLVGAVAMSPPTQLGDLLLRDIHDTAGAALTSFAVSSWSKIYPHLSESAIVDAAARPLVAEVSRGCIEDEAQGLVDLPGIVVLQHHFLSTDPATAPGWSTQLRNNDPSTTLHPVPLLVAQGLSDPIVRPSTTLDFVHSICGDGASVTLQTYPGVGHFQIRTVAPPHLLPWIRDRLAGSPLPLGCTTIVEH